MKLRKLYVFVESCFHFCSLVLPRSLCRSRSWFFFLSLFSVLIFFYILVDASCGGDSVAWSLLNQSLLSLYVISSSNGTMRFILPHFFGCAWLLLLLLCCFLCRTHDFVLLFCHCSDFRAIFLIWFLLLLLLSWLSMIWNARIFRRTSTFMSETPKLKQHTNTHTANKCTKTQRINKNK